jgi:hypothetical protein
VKAVDDEAEEGDCDVGIRSGGRGIKKSVPQQERLEPDHRLDPIRKPTGLWLRGRESDSGVRDELREPPGYVDRGRASAVWVVVVASRSGPRVDRLRPGRSADHRISRAGAG